MAAGEDWTQRAGAVALPSLLWRRLPPAALGWLCRRLSHSASHGARARLLARGLLPTPDIDLGCADWTATAATIEEILRSIDRRRPRTIVELGSGLSSFVLAAHAKTRSASAPLVVSLEHDGEYFARTKALLESAGLDSFVELLAAPLSPRGEGGLCYDGRVLKAALGSSRIDLAFIDGPPGPVGRRETLPLLAEFLADRAVVFLDDAARAAERESLRQWSRRLRPHLRRIRFLATERGLAVMEWRA